METPNSTMCDDCPTSFKADGRTPLLRQQTTNSVYVTVASPANTSTHKETQEHGRSEGGYGVFKKHFVIICRPRSLSHVLLGLLVVLLMAHIAIGAIYVDNCPAERLIPIYLIVLGCVGLVKVLFTMGRRRYIHANSPDGGDLAEGEGEDGGTRIHPVNALLVCFLLAWYIAGSVWIYRTNTDITNDVTSGDYCNPVLFLFAFWVTTATYVLSGVTLWCVCFTKLLASCCSTIENF